MQVMGQTAREMGMNSPFLSAMCDRAVGLAVGFKVLRKRWMRAEEMFIEVCWRGMAAAIPTMWMRYWRAS